MIKPTKEQLSLLYDVLYEEADKIFRESGICKNCPYDYKCCYPANKECEYHTPSGCSKESLGCKIYLCRNMIERYPEIYIKLKVLRNIACKYNLYHPLCTKEEVLNKVS